MIEHRRPIFRIVALALLATAGLDPSARAQAEGDEGEAPEPAPVLRVRRFAMNEAQFDQWVFANMGLNNAAGARDRLESMLTLQLDDLGRTCGLTPAQKKKLLLAGKGDIKRFLDRIEDLRRRFTKGPNDQNQFQQLWQEIQPLRNAVQAGFFGDDSLYAKALRGTLAPEQAAKHEAVVRDRMLYRYWARVDLAMELLNNEVGFTDDQRRRLVELLRQETKPPRRLGQNDYYAILYLLSRIPEAKIRPVFEDFQWGTLKRQLDQGRGMQPFLKQNGFVAADEEIPKDGTRGRPVRVEVAVPF